MITIDKDKPIDIMDQSLQDSRTLLKQTDQELKEATRVQSLFNGAWLAKQNLELHAKWRRFDDYYHGRQGYQSSPDDPNSNTDIIKPIIDSQIADLVDKPQSVQAAGIELSDDLYSTQVQHMLDYVLSHNKFKQKLELGEHDRLELGTSVYKVWFDEDALGGRGMPTYDIISPANFFPDPKITSYHLMQDAEFIIHATWKPLSWFRKKFKERGKYVQRQLNVLYDPKIFEGDQSDQSEYSTSQRALCIECYMKDDNGHLYCLTVAQNIILQDTREENGKLQMRDMYPFVVIPCYPQRGILWGQGDVEMLIPTQDLVNDLDDQIRINARLMGNPQIAFGIGAGRSFDARKWTSVAGLRVPMRDVSAFRVVEAKQVSPDVVNRREKAFQEADVISGRPDVTRGENPSGVTAFRAISALQQAGQKGVVHKKEMLKAGFNEVLYLLYDEIINNWTEEMWIRIEGQTPDYKYYDPRKLQEIEQLIPNEMFDGGENNKEPEHVPLTDDAGKKMTRTAEFDLQLSIGDGMPNDKAFIFDMIVDLAKMQVEGKPVIFWNELREYLREEVGIPLKNEEEMMQQQGQPGMQPDPAMGGLPQGMPAQMPQGQPQGMPQGVPMQPQQMMPPQAPQQQIPPEVLQQLVMQMMQAQQQQQVPNNVIPMQGGAPIAGAG